MTRSCFDCGRPVRPSDRVRCSRCHRRANPTQPCGTCGELRLIVGLGLCDNCWHQDPDRPFRQLQRLKTRLQDPPDWLDDFVAHAATRNCTGRTSRMISHLGQLLSEPGLASPPTLLERARRPGRSVGALARTLEDFFVDMHLAFPIDHEGRLAANRRQHRIDETPAPLRSAVARYADALTAGQGRARRAATRPRSDRTIVDDIAILRDLARFLIIERGKTDWAAVDVADIEAFLADKPLSRPRRRGVAGQFFRWARSQRIVLTNPTIGLRSGRIRGFRGRTLSLTEQRRLFRRWTADLDAHPHECLVGLLALLHAASSAQLRHLKIADVDPTRRTIKLDGRPQPVPLEPASWQALQRCLDHRHALRTHNPHVIVTNITRTRRTPASDQYLVRVLDPAQIGTRDLRATRLVDLIASLDPKLVCEAVGMSPAGVLPYAADHVQDTLLANL
jgi:site-specific recombinase XerD